jgi:tetratricopeptide (TPR) repeat protein
MDVVNRIHKRILAFIYCICCFCCNLNAQNNLSGLKAALRNLPDDTSKIRVLVLLSRELRDINVLQAAQYGEEAVKIADKVKNRYWLIRSLVQSGWATGTLGNYDKAFALFGKADSLAILEDADDLFPELWMAKGRVHLERHFHPESMKAFLEALKLFEKNGDSLGVAEVCNYAGGLYFFSGDYQQSYYYLTRSENIARNQNKQLLLAQILSNKGNTYAVLSLPDSSYMALWEAIGIYKRLENYGGLAKANTNIAMNFYDAKRYDSAMYFFQEAYRNDSLWSNPVGILYSKINIAAAYRKLNNPVKALEMALNALDGANNIVERQLQKTILEDIAEIYADMGMPEQSLKYYRRFNALKDSMLNGENARLVADMQTRYEVDKKEKSLQLLKAERSRNQVMMYSFLGLAVLIGLVGLLQYRLNKIKIRQAAEKLSFQEKQLAGIADSMIQKDELIEEISIELASLKNDSNQQRLDYLQELLQARVSTNDDWMIFQQKFEQIYPGFFVSLSQRFPNLTPTEIKICALEKLGLKDSQAGDLLGVNTESIRKGRYRLRKNMSEEEWEELRLFLQKV